MTDPEREKDEEKKAFTVRDRRRFTESGEPRETGEASEGGSHEAVQEPRQESREQQEGSRPEEKSERGAGAHPPITFSAFLVSLSTQALVCLGEVASPEDGQVRKDLDAARELIDIIAMLKDKTRGNVDPDEEKLVDNILYDLRMRFVRTARS